jgi:hypothetical protein
MVKAFFLAVAVACCCSLVAQTSAPNVVFRGKCDTGLPRFEDWFQQTPLAKGEPYVAPQSRQQELLNKYPKLKLAMSMTEVEKYLGKPDFGWGKPIARLATAPEPTDKRCNTETAYIVKKKGENMSDMEDVAIYLFYSRDGKLYWASPLNLPSLKQMGSPTGGE